MEKTITISVREYEELLALKETTAELRRAFEAKIAELQEQLEWCKRQIFGQKSERLIDDDSTPGLPGFEMPEATEPEKIKVPAHERRKAPKKDEGCPLELPDDMPTEVIECDIPAVEKVDPITGVQGQVIGYEEVVKLAYREQFVKKILRYPKYAFPGRPELGVVQAPAPPCIIQGSKFDTSFMAYVVYAKFALHLPLNRIQEDLANQGIKISRQTLSNLVVTLGTVILPLWELMIQKLLAQGVLFTDDTPLKQLNPGAGKTHQAQVFTYVGGGPNAPPYHVYQFTMNRSHKHVMTFLEDFVGLFHGDAFEAHVKLDQRNDITWAACWAHARRKFENAQSGDPEFRRWVLRKMRYLFMYERIAWTRTPMERLAIRQHREWAIVDEIFAAVKNNVLRGDLLPKSGLAKAANYLLRYEQNFRNYLYFPDLRMDNNISERSLRKLVLGRKNWLFVGSERAGYAAVALLSMVQTCRAMNINVIEYLQDLFTHFSATDDIERFLPDRWLARKASRS